MSKHTPIPCTRDCICDECIADAYTPDDNEAPLCGCGEGTCLGACGSLLDGGGAL